MDNVDNNQVVEPHLSNKKYHSDSSLLSDAEIHPEILSDIKEITLPEITPSSSSQVLSETPNIDSITKTMLVQLDAQEQRSKWICETLVEIHKQVRKTNGSVIRINSWIEEANVWRESTKQWMKEHAENHKAEMKEIVDSVVNTKKMWGLRLLAGAAGGALVAALVHVPWFLDFIVKFF